MTEPARRSVLIYAKPPRMGLAKTRLARSLGSHAEAQRISRMTTARTLRAASDLRWTTILYAAPDRHLSDTLGGLWPLSLPRASQGQGGLGDRLLKGLMEAPRGPVLFIGADAPDISSHLIWCAFRALLTHDAVFGPASDGGFWLFGMDRPLRLRSPFHPVRWSGPHAMQDTAANLPPASRIAWLPTLIDIDEAEDWTVWSATKSTTY